MNDQLSAGAPRHDGPDEVRIVRANTFAHEIVVDDTHIDRFGHANNVVILRWIQDVAEAHSAAVGFSLSDYERVGAGFVVRRHELDYLRPALLGERLTVRTWVPEAKRVSCRRGTEIAAADGQLIARAMTTWAFAELATLRPARIPDDIRFAFGFGMSGEGMSTAPAA
jgi:acyl-CoA thioester hydrolase